MRLAKHTKGQTPTDHAEEVLRASGAPGDFAYLCADRSTIVVIHNDLSDDEAFDIGIDRAVALGTCKVKLVGEWSLAGARNRCVETPARASL